MMSTTRSLEAHVTNRYDVRWQQGTSHYDYKHLKGARIGQIAAETGGLPAAALEIGVGPGAVAAALSRHGVNVIGIDLSAEAILSARGHSHADNVSLLRGSGFALPFRERTLPLVYASQVLHLFDSNGRLALMREAYRVLQPGGRFVFDMKNVVSHAFSVSRYTKTRRTISFPPHSELVLLLRQAGFSTVTRRPGLLPFVRWTKVPNLGVLRVLAHTTFFVATRDGSGDGVEARRT